MPSRLRVLAAGFAALKGTRHLTYDAVELDEHGPVGDRAYCLVDVERRRVLRTVQNPRLMTAIARLDGSVLSVRVPGEPEVTAIPEPTGQKLVCEYWGREVALELQSGPHAEAFSALLGTEVRLAAAPRGGVVYGDPITLISAASLRDLAERTARPGIAGQSGRFRPSLVVETGAAPFAEEDWLGREVSVGDVRLRLGPPVPRCAVIDHDPETGLKDVRLLKQLASYRPLNAAGEPCFGVFAHVLSPGTVAAG